MGLLETCLALVADGSHDHVLGHLVVSVERNMTGLAARNDQLAYLGLVVDNTTDPRMICEHRDRAVDDGPATGSGFLEALQVGGRPGGKAYLRHLVGFG